MNTDQPQVTAATSCPCGLPDCSDAPYVLPEPEYRYEDRSQRVPLPREPRKCERPGPEEPAEPDDEPDGPRVPAPREPAEVFKRI